MGSGKLTEREDLNRAHVTSYALMPKLFTQNVEASPAISLRLSKDDSTRSAWSLSTFSFTELLPKEVIRDSSCF